LTTDTKSTHSAPLTVRDIEDVALQRREWTVQRVWWVVLVVLLGAALAGLFSTGPLSDSVAGGSGSGVLVQYERFVHHTGQATWTLHIEPAAVSGHKATVFVSEDLARAMQVENVSPAPSTETSTRQGWLMEFDVPHPESPPVVRIGFRPDEFGVHDGVVRAGRGAGARLWLLFYP
jgi:hypothetical protein